GRLADRGKIVGYEAGVVEQFFDMGLCGHLRRLPASALPQPALDKAIGSRAPAWPAGWPRRIGPAPVCRREADGTRRMRRHLCERWPRQARPCQGHACEDCLERSHRIDPHSARKSKRDFLDLAIAKESIGKLLLQAENYPAALHE